MKNMQESYPNGDGAQVEPFIDRYELAKRLKMQPRTLAAWMRRGLVPYYKLDRIVRFRWSDALGMLLGVMQPASGLRVFFCF